MRRKRDINGLRLAEDLSIHLRSMMRKIFIATFAHKYPSWWKETGKRRGKKKEKFLQDAES